MLPTKDPRIQHAAEQMTENLDIILAEGQRLTSLINDLLDLEKIEAGQMVWHMAPVAIPAILQQAYETTQSLFEGREVRLVVLPFPDLPMVTGDSNRLLQVVINLISNASKFTKRGEVTLSAQQTGDEVWVSVRDQGIGIDPADQEMIFEKFRQVGDTLTEKPSGTGLGLAICKQIVEHHGGCIWVVSELGNGSTFTFSLPIPKDALVEDVELEKELPTEHG